MKEIVLLRLVILWVTIWSSDVLAANILVISPFSSPSHYGAIKHVLEELAKRGHNVTVITSFKDEVQAPNYRHIKVDPFDPTKALVGAGLKKEFKSFNMTESPISILPKMWTMLLNMVNNTITSHEVQDFIQNDESDFDVVICEDFFMSPFYMLAHKYKAPLILYAAHGDSSNINTYMKNPQSFYYSPSIMFESNEYNLWAKIKTILFTVFLEAAKLLLIMPKHNEIAREHFGHLAQPLPDLRDIERNVSLVLMTTHFSIDVSRYYLPNIMEIGDVHVRDPKSLPKDIKSILDNAKDGVIYVSLGSNIKSKDLPREKLDVFLEVFSQLKQTVLWKWEDESMPGKPENVITRNWFPQSDILAHPNVRLFFTHGGLMSTIETIHRGVPIIGMPIGVNQANNVGKAVRAGYAELISYNTLETSTLKHAIDKVLNDPKYKNKVEELSRLFKDRPASAMDRAVRGIETVIKYKGGYHMKMPTPWMIWYQYYLLELIALLGIVMIPILLATVYIVKIGICKIFSKIFNWNTAQANAKTITKKPKKD